MAKVLGLRCRECGEEYPVSPVHVCELCFGPLEIQLNWEEIGPGAAWPGAALAADELTCASTSARSCPGLVAYPALRAQEHDQVRLIRALMSPSSAGSLAAN